MIKRSILSLVLVAATATAASAQWYPGYQQDSYRNGRSVQARGIVASYNWYDLQLQTGNGRDAYVHLHQGTIINPRGTTLRSGMPVRVIGYVDGSGTLQANEIDIMNNRCAYGNGNGYYNGNGTGNGNAYGRCNARNGRNGDADDRRDNDDDQGDRDNQNRGNQYQYPSPYQTYPPNS